MPKTRTKTPEQLARAAADRYFAALATEIPYDNAPGDVDLIAAVTDILDAINERDGTDKDGWEVQGALNAGYVLGVEIGRRIGGTR